MLYLAAARISKSLSEQALFLIGFAGHGHGGIAGGVDDVPELLLVDGSFREQNRLMPGMRGLHLFDGKIPPDGVVYMGFAHAALHALHFQRILDHRISFN